MLVNDRTEASFYRSMNAQGIFKRDDVGDNLAAAYWYSSELGIFNMRNSKYKGRHNVIEHMIIMSMEDIAPSAVTRWMIWCNMMDLDTIMMNQIAFTF